MIVFRICAVRLFFVWFFVHVFFRSGTQFPCACGNAHFLRGGGSVANQGLRPGLLSGGRAISQAN